MNDNNTKKKAIFLLLTYFIILFTPKLKKNQSKITYNNHYLATDNNEFATYNNYHIYIDDKESIELIMDDSKNNIYVIDGRSGNNPNMAICNSFQIKDPKLMQEILKILLEYEKQFPSAWNRTLSSMEKEWFIHNICHSLGLEIGRTSEVDLDNLDEENFQNIITIIHTLLNDEYYQKETGKIKVLTK